MGVGADRSTPSAPAPAPADANLSSEGEVEERRGVHLTGSEGEESIGSGLSTETQQDAWIERRQARRAATANLVASTSSSSTAAGINAWCFRFMFCLYTNMFILFG